MTNMILDIETTGINPLASRITAIGLLIDEDEPVIIMEESEENMIKRLNKVLDKVRPIEVIGWYVKEFDLPFLKIRALKYRIPFWIDARIIDLAFNFQKPERIHMKQLAEFLGIKHVGTASILMPDAYHDKDYDKIKKHLTDDLFAIKTIWKIWNEC